MHLVFVHGVVTHRDIGSTVATIQTLSRPGRLRKFNVRFTKALIVDEAHHAAAES